MICWDLKLQLMTASSNLVKIAFSWFSIVVTSSVCIRIINEDLRFDKSISSSRISLGSERFIEQLFQCSVIELEENRDTWETAKAISERVSSIRYIRNSTAHWYLSLSLSMTVWFIETDFRTTFLFTDVWLSRRFIIFRFFRIFCRYVFWLRRIMRFKSISNNFQTQVVSRYKFQIDHLKAFRQLIFELLNSDFVDVKDK